MREFPAILQCETLRLRPLQETDLPEVSAQLSNERVAPWLAAISLPFDEANAHELLAHSRHDGEALRVIERDGALIGGLCIGAALWYWLVPEQWRRGLMKQALQLAIGAHFARLGPPMIATCHQDNVSSQKLLVRLGFSCLPSTRKMFFHSTRRAETCQEYLMSPEQWHLLHPPTFRAGDAVLRPARQKDARILARAVWHPGDGPWPDNGALSDFIEVHRFRGPSDGLFVIKDNNERAIGMALLQDGNIELCFVSADDARIYEPQVRTLWADGGARAFNP